jgi:hypothetical protein
MAALYPAVDKTKGQRLIRGSGIDFYFSYISRRSSATSTLEYSIPPETKVQPGGHPTVVLYRDYLEYRQHHRSDKLTR